ncbi:MAG: L,D-transpeptidase [Betaproteobacteria bacterium]|nr:L,D-transpeptidase [Betaproteobacteria bacterium]MDE2309737.1 L,D-transpeptidase [Betaproteobacteria bacterium]
MRILLLLLALTSALNPAYAGEHGGTLDSRSMEALLVESLLSVSSNKLDVALNEVDSLLKIKPNFKLAQLVRGDLLLARARPLNDFGNAPDASRERMEDLRDEARVRLRRFQEQSPAALVPKFLWQLDAQQRHAIVVDTSKSTLYLYENVNGEPRYVADFYISSGKNGSEKVAEGDQKTPLGVYFINASLPKNKLTDFYGSAAYPLSYPNEWDRKQGRDGHGIWLHGTPSNTYSRPPRASNGCVVLSNEDLENLGKLLQVGVTPVIITNQMDWSDEQSKADRAELLSEIEQWRADWSGLDTDTYLGHYARDFSSGSADFSAWAQQKKQVNAGKSWIKVNLSNISVFAYPNQPNMAVVNFEQDYASNNLNNRMKKRQYWMKRDNRWQIVYEGAA